MVTRGRVPHRPGGRVRHRPRGRGRHRPGGRGAASGSGDGRGQAGHGRVVEQRPDRQVDPVRRGDPGHQLGGFHRMSTQDKEVVGDSDRAGYPQQSRHQVHQFPLQRGARGEGRGTGRGVPVGRRQRAQVQLAARGPGQLRQSQNDRGDHVVGQEAPRVRQQPGWRLGRDRVGHHVPDQPRAVAVHIRHSGDDRLPHPRVAAQHRLHLGGLDPEPAHLHLPVDAAQRRDPPAGQPPAQVAAAVEPRPRREGVG